MSRPNSPIVNAGMLYVNGLNLAWSANKVLNLAAGQARDSTDTNDIILNDPVQINGAVVGANGVDLAVVVASQMYAVYVIASSKSVFTSQDRLAGNLSLPAPENPIPVAGLLSLAANAEPFLPQGYDMWRRVGWAATDNAGNLVKFWQYDLNDQARKIYWDQGAALTAVASVTPVAVPLNVASVLGAGIPSVPVPPLACEVLFDVTLSAAGTCDFLPFGSAAPRGQVRFGGGVGAISSLLAPCKLNAGVPTVLADVSAGSLGMFVAGFVDLL